MNHSFKRSDFPANFILGTATSSYQIEGTSLGECGPSHWDSFAANGGTANGEDGAIACAHIDHWEADLDLIAACGMDAYRFSTAWPRIQPDGQGAVNESGLDFYDRLVDGLLDRGIEPHLTLYHWDLPQALADQGGWTHRDTAAHFGNYAGIVARRLGDRVKSIATINEPWCVAWLSHFLGHHAPGLRDISAAAPAMHHILLAHGWGMQALRDENLKNCLQGIVLNMEISQPASNDPKDVAAAQLQDGIYNRWFADAIFKGAYPADVLRHLSPHMPTGWQDDMSLIAQPVDWLGLNYYTRSIIRDDGTGKFPYGAPVIPEFDPGNPDRTSLNWEIYPQGLTEFLTRIEREYTQGLPIMVSENGMANFDRVQDGAVDDPRRVAFFDKYLSATRDAIAQGANVQGYFAWSLLDNFEWAFGYDQRFGIVHVDFVTQKRTPKSSWHWLKEFAEN